MSLEHCLDATPVDTKLAVHVNVQNSPKFLKKNEQHHDNFLKPIQRDFKPEIFFLHVWNK